MRSKIRNALIVVMGASCILGQGVSAQNGCCERGKFGVFAEAIYVKPTTGGMDWAVSDCTQSTVTPSDAEPATGFGTGAIIIDLANHSVAAGLPGGSVKRRGICPSYNWGFRVGGEYTSRSGCSYAQLAGSYVHFQDGAKLAGNLVPVLPFVYDSMIFGVDELPPTNVPIVNTQATWCVMDGVGHGSLKTDYWDIDARFGRYIHRDCGMAFQLWGGVRYVNICEMMTARFGGGSFSDAITSRSLAQVRKREFSGAGPEIGIGGKFDVWCNFYARGELSALAVIGSRKAFVKAHAHEELDTGSELPVPVSYTQCFRFDNCVNVCPGFETRLAVGYSRKCGCLDGSLEFGYTLTHFWNILSGGEQLASPNMAASNSSFERDFGVAGPYLGLRLNY
jgi:Legionella pneumophila major outer membrane protein precursor